MLTNQTDEELLAANPVVEYIGQENDNSPDSIFSPLKKQELDLKLKTDSETNGFKIDGDYLVFDKTANLSYVMGFGVTLQMLLTKNPLVTLTRLNKNLLVKFLNATAEFGKSFQVVASYRSPEYAMLSFADDKHLEYSQGKALALSVTSLDDVNVLINCLEDAGITDITAYANSTVYFSLSDGKLLDKTREDSPFSKVSNLVVNDSFKNYIMIALLVVAGWFLFLRKK